MIREFKKDNLKVKIAGTRKEMGQIAGTDIANKIIELQEKKDEINIIFAAAPSQNEVLETLVSIKEIKWNKINAFHMDEYIGLDENASQRFGNFLKNAIFGKVDFKSVNYINGNADNLDAEIERYTKLLTDHPTDIVCLGIGENGHIAFNDPPVADFNDKAMIKAVKLDEICRQQQVNDGCFESIDKVPSHAVTLTIPALCKGSYMFCSVPAIAKANAVKAVLNDEIDEKCPATILRNHKNACLYCDADSSSKL